jgi:hypothetical protein
MLTAWKCAKASPRTLATKELAVASQQRTVSHFLFSSGNFLPKQHDCRPHPSYVSLFPQLKIKLKGCHFDTTEVIDAELQVVLNTLTEHGCQDAFKKRQKHWER